MRDALRFIQEKMLLNRMKKKPEWPLLHRAPPTASEGVVTGPVTDRAAPTEGRGSRPRVRVAPRTTVCAECTVAAMGEPAQYRMALGMPSRDVMASFHLSSHIKLTRIHVPTRQR